MDKFVKAIFLRQMLIQHLDLNVFEEELAETLRIIADPEYRDLFEEMLDHADICMIEISKNFNRKHYQELHDIRHYIDEYK